MPRRPWENPSTLLFLMSIAKPNAFSTWTVLLNNFAVERAAFTGVEIGILQSLREVPRFLAFTNVFALLTPTAEPLPESGRKQPAVFAK